MEENSGGFYYNNLAMEAAMSFNNLQNKFIGVDSDQIGSFLSWKHQLNESFKDENNTTIKEEKRIECEECYLSFSGKFNFIRHHKRKHPNIFLKSKYCKEHNKFEAPGEVDHKVKEYDCELCGSKYKGKQTLRWHIRVKHRKSQQEVKKYKCDVCAREFDMLTLLNTHTRRVHTKAHKCQDCDNRFGTRCELRKHIMHKHDGIAYKCNICETVLSNERSFERHNKDVHSGETHNCNRCEFTTKTKRHLDEHTKFMHEGISFDCQLCDAKYKSKTSLQNHIQIKHENRTKLKCDLCNFESHEKRTVKIHRASIHEGKRIECDECDIPVSIRGLSEHKQKYHNDMILRCEHCSFVTKTKKKLRYHGENKHGMVYKCVECTKEITGKHNLYHHKRNFHTIKKTELHMCDQCDFKTTRKTNLTLHLKRHGESLICENCPYETTNRSLLKRHIEFEHKGLGYVCTICGDRKSRKCYLEQHMISKHKIVSE